MKRKRNFIQRVIPVMTGQVSCFLFFTGMLLPATTSGYSQAWKDADMLIRHVHIIPMNTEGILHDQVVAVKNNRIVQVMPDTLPAKLSTTATIYTCKDQYLMPGLADMHCHFPDTGKIKRYFALQLMNGVTTLRSMRGDLAHLAFRTNKTLVQPHLYLSAPPVTSDTSYTLAMADELISKARASGYDFIKILGVKDSASFFHIMKVANAKGMEVAGHYPSVVSYPAVVNSGYKTIEHLSGLVNLLAENEPGFMTLMQQHISRQVYHCPTLDFYQVAYFMLDGEQLKKGSGYSYATADEKKIWKEETLKNLKEPGKDGMKKYGEMYANIQPYHFKIIKYLADHTDLLLLGVDAGGYYSLPGFAMLEEMKLYEKAGLSRFQILRSATINAATYMGQSGDWGTIEAGKQVNFIVLEKNPLEGLENIQTLNYVFLDNEVYTNVVLKKTASHL